VPVFANENTCDTSATDLQGSVSRNEATVTNHSTNCDYEASLALYESPKEPETYGWIEAQKYIGSKSVTVKAGQTVTLRVDYSSSACFFQSDLIRGGEGSVIRKDAPAYRTAMDVDVYSQSCVTPTPTPGNPGTGGGDNSTTTTNNVVTTVTEKLAKTGDAALVYAFVIAGFATLAIGFFMRKAAK
jgi:hypothetical protein